MPRLVCLAVAVAVASVPVPGRAAVAGARDHVMVVGSSTVFPFAAAVAESFGRRGPWRTPVVESIGTGGGFKLFCSGAGPETPDVTDASRPMTDAERESCASHGVTGVAAFRLGSDGIVVAEQRRSAGLALTREQLYRAIARSVVVGGRLVPNPYRRWREIDPGLPDRPIRVFGPAPNHGTRDAWVALVMLPACERQRAVAALSPEGRQLACRTVREDGAWIDVAGDYAVLLGKLAGDPDAVAVFTYAYLDKNRDRIQAATVDGVAPSLAAIAGAGYPLSRPLFLYVKTAHVGQVPGLVEFVQEFLSERAIGGDGYLVDRGLIPMPAAARDAERAKLAALGGRPR